MDWMKVGLDLIVAVTPIVTFVILWAIKSAWEKIPASYVLFLAPIVANVVNFGLNWYAGNVANFSPLAAAALGLLATALREWISTLEAKGLKGPVTPTKYSL